MGLKTFVSKDKQLQEDVRFQMKQTLQQLEQEPKIKVEEEPLPDFDFHSEQDGIVFNKQQIQYLQHPNLFQKERSACVVFLKPNEKFELALYNYLRLQQVLADTYFVFCFQGISQLED